MIKTIEVKKEHIMKGRPTSPDRCAVALALRAAGIKQPSVTGWDFDTRTQVGIPLPKRAQTFITRFDACDTKQDKEKLKPLSFRVKLDA